MGVSPDRRHELEFLPAALEIVETPPSPAGRALGLIIVIFFASAVLWASLGKVDIQASAPGRLMPVGDVKTIQPVETGVVRRIRVQDGDHVRAGQVLIELDPTQTGADQDRLKRDLLQAELDVARLTALKQAATSGGAPRLADRSDAQPLFVAEAQAAMRAQADQQAAKIASLDQQINEKRAEADEVSAETDKLNASIPMLAEKDRIHHELAQRGYGTTLAELDAQRELGDARHQLSVLVHKRAQAVDGRVSLERQKDSVRSQYLADVLSDLRKAEEAQNALTQGLIKADDRTRQTELRSPIDGVVEQLTVHTPQGVVTPAQHLMIIVPESNKLMVEARLANRDVGFVREGQSVKVKVETFNFTRYGQLEGKVVGVSRDVINEAERQANGNPASGAADARSAPPTYLARILLSQSSMTIDGRVEPLQPGMIVTAEIKTGERSILDYLLSPVARRGQESLHER